MLGYTQAFSSLGGLMVALANSAALKWSNQLPALNLPSWLHLSGNNDYSVMDLFRFSGSGTHQFTKGAPSYFSLDGGAKGAGQFSEAVEDHASLRSPRDRGAAARSEVAGSA